MKIEFADTNQSWDEALAELRGHPLQSDLWGRARKRIDGIVDHRWLVRIDGRVAWMARVEERRVPGLGRVAWVPKGLSDESTPDATTIRQEFTRTLRQAGFLMVVSDRWALHAASEGSDAGHGSVPQTIWIDLALGTETLWRNVDAKVRHSVARARRENVVCERSGAEQDLEWFARLCKATAQSKGFESPGSLELMKEIVRGDVKDGCSGHLFIARYQGEPAAGALILRCGRTIHYMWGGSDRKFSRVQAGEALQWAVVEWAIDTGHDLYDLEGIDPLNNPGVFKFKKKLGGDIVCLEGKRYQPLTWRGNLLEIVRRHVKSF